MSLLFGLFGNTLALVEAIAELLVVLVRGMISEHLLACGTLECLEARLAFDSLGSGVSFQLALGFLWASIAFPLALLLCFGSVTHGDMWLQSVAGCESE